jgi:hypothetical protein
MFTQPQSFDCTHDDPDNQEQPVGPGGVDAEAYPDAPPVAVVLDFPGLTLRHYERLTRHIFRTPREPGVPGCLYHWVRVRPEGVRVIEVWRTRCRFEAFWAEVALPRLQHLQLPEPACTFCPVPSFIAEEIR